MSTSKSKHSGCPFHVIDSPLKDAAAYTKIAMEPPKAIAMPRRFELARKQLPGMTAHIAH
jgi:hypothetical protein